MKVVHFGAGNIGKGLILPILKASPQIKEFIFVDNDQNLVDHLKTKRQINLELFTKDAKEDLKLTNFQIISSSELFTQEGKTLIQDVDIITTSVGQVNLSKIVDSVKHVISINEKPKIIICCENGNRVSSYFKELLQVNDEKISFVDCIIDRIIPNQNFLTANTLFAEKYYTWICDNLQWPQTFSKIQGLTYVENLENEIEKKLCLLNGVHCAIAWYQFNQDNFEVVKTVYEALQNSKTLEFIDQYIDEIACAISDNNQTLKLQLKEFGEKTIERFLNKKIDDNLDRVGRNPLSKLTFNERIFTPLLLAISKNTKREAMLKVLKSGICYWNKTDPQSVEMKMIVYGQGLKDLFINKFGLSVEISNLLIAEL
ncbi:mannitol-1-phosphate 5-dehydrogenase [Spiroplasma clarkii]|uniref:Mannitol-1-phosphate 5-dehydrogenase n=1 Tax=Spiroplasma clarkii TaxID=2139 RepID=A0A1Y0KZ74_9MOLU|nr:hypothetical protein [Spiroplasma clarkii]ARU91021.1 mannitol-1-phosphate 5-dehydrogenase [Spiroplasma clarkii]ATX70463.1 mannitol-1-phosphate 5-dehydrogenase [Spiroplasma clarkii]